MVAGLALSAVACAPQPRRPATSLVVAYPAVPRSLVSSRSADELSNSVLRNAYEPLVDFGDDLSVKPSLAESWHNPDPFTWVFRMRAGVRRHDGGILEAADVARFLNAAAGPDSRRSSERYIASIIALDARTLVLRTRQPASLLNSFFSANLVAIETDPTHAVGTGPYVVREFVPEVKVVLEAFDGHRDGSPAIRRVEFRAVPEAAARAALVLGGQAHLAVDVPPARFRAASSTPGVKAIASHGLRSMYLGLNAIPERRADGRPNPFRDLRVRQAIALALDKAALAQGPLEGYADVIEELVPGGAFGHHGAIPPRGFDPERARRLLAAAGYGRGLTARLAYIAGRYRGMEEVVAVLGEQLRAVGIEVRPQPATLSEFRTLVSDQRQSELFLVSWLSSTGDAAAVFNVLVHSPKDGAGRYSGFADDGLDGLLDRSFLPMRHNERLELLKAAAERVHAEVATIPLYRQHDLWLVSDALEFTPRPDRRVRVFDMAFKR